MQKPPAEELAKAQSVIDALRDQLARLFDTIPSGPNSAVRFEPGEEQR
ncbi:MAG: hypothetical protein SGI92_21705 [Bryobacteraceae bacterium]|nr:hypothetical protein [Bryobacteraceae bacterium]